MSLSAQNPDSKRLDHWYFGNGAGLDFSSGSPVADTTGTMQVWKGSTTMSDTYGDLLFYSDGRHVWNAQHDTMANGDIWGIPPTVYPMDCVIAIPKPQDDDIYYIFTSDGTKLTQQNGLQYHIVDMSLNGGLGAVTQKNIPLYNPVTEQLCAVRHGNTCDYWLITHEKNSNNYLSFQITAAGVDPNPVVSPAGLDYTVFTCQVCEYIGGVMLRATPQGDKIAAAVSWRWQVTGHFDEIHLSHFDNQTGFISNTFGVALDSTFAGFSFSPNGNILYAEYGDNWLRLDQFDLSLFDSLNVEASRNNIRSSTEKEFSSALAIANNQKIYGTTMWGWALNKDSIPVIHQPNVWGPGCMLEEWGMGLNSRFSQFLMPLSVSDFTSITALEHCTIGLEEIESSEVYAWFNGDALNISYNIYLSNTPLGIRLFNSIGQQMFDAVLEADHGNILQTKNLCSGIYFLELKGERTEFQKLYKP